MFGNQTVGLYGKTQRTNITIIMSNIISRQVKTSKMDSDFGINLWIYRPCWCLGNE